MSTSTGLPPEPNNIVGDLPPDRNPRGYNVIVFAVMSGGWIAPLLMFWLYVWGPLRPFSYPVGDLFPDPLLFAAIFAGCLAMWWLPSRYFRIRAFERSGSLYRLLGVRWFRRFVPDGDLANRWQRRRNPHYRVISDRQSALAFVVRTQHSERGHLVLLAIGTMSALFAWQIGWRGWAVYLAVGNVLVNVYPVLLQRYTRTRLASINREQRRSDEPC